MGALKWEPGKCQNKLQNSHTAHRGPKMGNLEKLRWSTKFPDGLESFRMACKVSKYTVRGSLKSFQIACKFSRWSVMFPDGLESFQMAWKVSRFYGQFVLNLQGFIPYIWPASSRKNFPGIQKLSRGTKTFQGYKNFPGRIATLVFQTVSTSIVSTASWQWIIRLLHRLPC